MRATDVDAEEAWRRARWFIPAPAAYLAAVDDVSVWRRPGLSFEERLEVLERVADRCGVGEGWRAFVGWPE